MAEAVTTKSNNVFWTINALLGVAFIVELSVPRFSAALDGVFISMAAIASMAALQRHLPLQNVLLAAVGTASIGGIAHGLSSNTNVSMPFGPIVFNPSAGEKIFNFVPWTIPLLWVVAILNARGVARLILRPWRKIKNYGYWLIGLTAVLAMAFDVALEPFVWYVKHFWFWQHTKLSIGWEGTNILNFIGWVFVSLLIMMLVTPALIRKQPGNPSAPDLHPLALWVGAFVLFAAGCGSAHLWWAVAIDAAIAGTTAVFAVRGARW